MQKMQQCEKPELFVKLEGFFFKTQGYYNYSYVIMEKLNPLPQRLNVD